ncbi:MAG: hypothetical protein ACOX6U_03325 [Oscillospiraceae bacterium]|jgi:hypothetical protein
MKQKRRAGKIVTGTFCGICIAFVLAAVSSALLLLYAMANTTGGQSLNLFGFAVYLNDASAPMDGYEPGAAVIVQEVPHNTLIRGDIIVCRDLDVNNQYYPVTRIVSSFQPESPLTITVETFGDNEIQTVNRDDVVGKCVFSSSTLGHILALLGQDRGLSSVVLVSGCCLLLFFVFLLWFLLLGRRMHKAERCKLPEDGAPPDLSALVEPEHVPLVLASPAPTSSEAAASVHDSEPHEPAGAATQSNDAPAPAVTDISGGSSPEVSVAASASFSDEDHTSLSPNASFQPDSTPEQAACAAESVPESPVAPANGVDSASPDALTASK